MDYHQLDFFKDTLFYKIVFLDSRVLPSLMHFVEHLHILKNKTLLMVNRQMSIFKFEPSKKVTAIHLKISFQISIE